MNHLEPLYIYSAKYIIRGITHAHETGRFTICFFNDLFDIKVGSVFISIHFRKLILGRERTTFVSRAL